MAKRNAKNKADAETKQLAPAVKPDPNAVQLVLKPGEDQALKTAQTYLRPTVQAACTVRAFNKGKENEGPELAGLIAELSLQVKAVNDGNLKRAEGMLIAQAHSLDTIFGNLARRANAQEYLTQFETYLRLALKAQSQCRATLETLATIKNPVPVAFVKQANIAHGPQQVNNAAAPAGDVAPARENNQNAPNKLLEAQHGERLDTGTASAAGGANPQLATMEAINGAALGSGQG
jgi:hypothetical protein